ncbi:hypothetical protein ACQPZG_00525 (plasmid) [Streptomyces sp. CA-294286]
MSALLVPASPPAPYRVRHALPRTLAAETQHVLPAFPDCTALGAVC